MTLTTGPQALSLSTLASAPYYITNSYEDGTYALDVRGSTTTTYRLYGYYPSYNGNNAVISTVTVGGISVNAGLTTSGVDFAF